MGGGGSFLTGMSWWAESEIFFGWLDLDDVYKLVSNICNMSYLAGGFNDILFCVRPYCADSSRVEGKRTCLFSLLLGDHDPG